MPRCTTLPAYSLSEFKRCSSLSDRCFCPALYFGCGLNVSFPKPLQFPFNRYPGESLMLSTSSPYQPSFSSLPQSPNLAQKTSSPLPPLDFRPRPMSSSPALARSDPVLPSPSQIGFCAFVSPLSTQDVSISPMGRTSSRAVPSASQMSQTHTSTMLYLPCSCRISFTCWSLVWPPHPLWQENMGPDGGRAQLQWASYLPFWIATL